MSEPLIDISKDAFVKNGLDIDEAMPFLPTEMLLEPVIGHVMTGIVQYLNDTGHELAAQALDDVWYSRDEQWWREPDGFDARYKHGEEKRKEIFGE